MDKNESAYEYRAISKLLGLHRIQRLCSILGNPQNKLKIVHVAGTNGKGSTCVFIESILMSAGYCVGKYSSPELLCSNERVVVDGRKIETNELVLLFDEIHNAAVGDEVLKDDMPSHFEIWTMIAFVYFVKKGCDIVILETMLGGRLDATNVCQPIVNVITPVAIDHHQILGDSVEKIAFEKASIIKQGAVVVSSKQDKEVDAEIKSVCDKKGCRLERVDEKDIKFCGIQDFCEIISYKKEHVLLLGLSGKHQAMNAATAIEAIIALRSMGFSVTSDNIKRGLKSAVHNGRMELFCRHPLLLFDGAHNEQGAKALCASLKRYCPDKRFRFVMASMRDKCISEMLNQIKDFAHEFIAVSVKDNPRAMSCYKLRDQMQKTGVRSSAAESIDDLIWSSQDTVVCGSLYLYSDFYYAFMNRNEQNLETNL